jgi:hypothetical protein
MNELTLHQSKSAAAGKKGLAASRFADDDEEAAAADKDGEAEGESEPDNSSAALASVRAPFA